MKNLILFFLLALPFLSFAQIEEEGEFDYNAQISQNEVDTTDWDAFTKITLSDTKAYSLKLNTVDEKKYYLWLEKRVDDIYPFLQKAVSEYYQVKDSARNIKNSSQKKAFIKKRYELLANQYEDKLKNLTVSRGQILTRLIERETKVTTFDMIKEMRGGMNAFLWNAAGGAFSIDLKQRFDPKRTREDLFLEVILQRGLASGKYPEINDYKERVHRINPILKAFGRK